MKKGQGMIFLDALEKKQGRKRPLDTRMIERREREKERERKKGRRRDIERNVRPL